jgi:hypothetical protein
MIFHRYVRLPNNIDCHLAASRFIWEVVLPSTKLATIWGSGKHIRLYLLLSHHYLQAEPNENHGTHMDNLKLYILYLISDHVPPFLITPYVPYIKGHY